MGRERLLAVAQALADHDARHEAGDTGIDVHHGAAREVDGAEGEDVAGVSHHRVERSLRSGLGGAVGGGGNGLGGSVDRIRVPSPAAKITTPKRGTEIINNKKTAKQPVSLHQYAPLIDREHITF